MFAKISACLNSIRQDNPLILNITNYVSMEFVANGLLSLGASPIMIHSDSEVCDLLKQVNAVVINIGTLDAQFIQLAKTVCHLANQLNKPLILDPVGAGASFYRTETCLEFLKTFQFSAIRGNASEIMALSNSFQNSKGVDTSLSTLDVIEAGKHLSCAYNLIVVISGQTDAVIQATQYELFERGSPLMPKVTGSGCLLSAVLAAFIAVCHDTYTAACAAILFYSVCGEQAAAKAIGPGSFKTHFLDALFQLPSAGAYEKQ